MAERPEPLDPADPRGESWQEGRGDTVDHQRDVASSFVPAGARARFQQVLAGAAVGLVAVALLLSALWSRSQDEVQKAADPSGAAAGQPIVPDEVPYSSLPAGAGLAWADQVQEDKNALLLPPDPVGGFGTGTYRSETINVDDGQRRTLAPQPCGCDPVDVWLVGGSAAFGSGQRDDHTIASELVRLAEADGVAVRVRNLGVPGFALWQELQRVLAELAGGAPAPDLVVFYDGFNDLTFSFTQTINLGPRWSRPVVDVALPDQLDPLAALVALGSDGLDAAMAPYGGAAGIGARAGERYADLAALASTLLAGSGIPSEFFVQPDALVTHEHRADGWDAPMGTSPALRAVTDALEVAIEAAVEEVPARARSLRHVFDDVHRALFFDSVHTNEDGARVVAEALFELLRPRLRDAAAGGGR